jgi:hypothetical protein
MDGLPEERLPIRSGGDPLEPDLRRLAERYSAPADSLERIERRVVDAFRESFAGRPTANTELAGPSRLVLARWHRPVIRVHVSRRVPAFHRRAAALGLAAVFVLAGGVAVASAEAGPGRPLFAVRLAVERALLPANPGADRIQAQLAVLDRRLIEAADVDADPDALGDAARAYRATLAELLPMVQQAQDQSTAVQRRVVSQLAAIDQLRDRATPPARRELDAAARDAGELLESLRVRTVDPAGNDDLLRGRSAAGRRYHDGARYR